MKKFYFNIFIFFFIIYILSKEVVLLNEEIFVIITVIGFIYLIYRNLSNLLSMELQNRSNAIIQFFTSFYTLKINSILKVIDASKKFTKISNIFSYIYFSFIKFYKEFFFNNEIKKNQNFIKNFYQELMFTTITEEINNQKVVFKQYVNDIFAFYFDEQKNIEVKN